MNLEPDRWSEVRRFLEEALEREGADRDAFLTDLGSRDAALRDEVGRLVASAEAAEGFLERPALHASDEEDTLPPGTILGAWRVEREIGQGGMGRVFLAVRADGAFQQEAALKVIPSGLGGVAIGKRFRNERQILAGLEHPNIARLLDGGTTPDGRPFFVMEYVRGEHLVEYARRRELSIEGKVELFRKICAAVAYAHRHLVVHRDLKPGNILVTPEGEPKLLDFGLAKVFDPAVSELTPGATGALGRLMTPEYASPEQVRGDTITTASDVYSLGVVLYELLAGRLPFAMKGRSAEMIVRTVCETEPARLGGGISDDLESVVAMALRKEPERRYATVEQFSGDLRRTLEGLPVTARKDTVWYRARKFASRHRIAVAATAGSALLLAVLAAVAVVQAHAARLERERAERRYGDVRALVKSFLFEQHDAIQNLPGTTQARAMLIRRALEQLSALERESGPEFPLRGEMADAYEKLGDVLGGGVWSDLGDTAGARDAYEKALALRDRLAAGAAATPQARENLARVEQKMAGFLARTNEVQEAIRHARRSVGIREELAASGARTGEGPTGRASAHYRLGFVLSRSGDFRAALASYREAETFYRQALAATPDDLTAQRLLGGSIYDQAAMLSRLGEHRAALDTGRRALESRRALLKRDPANARYRLDVATSLHDVAEYLAELGELEESLEMTREASRSVEELADADPKSSYLQAVRANFRGDMGEIERRSGDSLRALESERTAAAVMEQVADADPEFSASWTSLAKIYARAGDARLAAGKSAPEPARHTAPCDWWRKSAAVWAKLDAQGKVPGEDVPFRDAIAQKVAGCASAPAP
ncbi:MAG: protein kinase [Thermoanaerobaculia bacterium]